MIFMLAYFVGIGGLAVEFIIGMLFMIINTKKKSNY